MINDKQEWADFDFEIIRFQNRYSVYELGEEGEKLGIQILHGVTRQYLDDLYNVIGLVLARTKDEDKIIDVRMKLKEGNI